MNKPTKTLSQFITIISDEKRLAMIHVLGEGKKTFTEIKNALKLESNVCAYHIDQLETARIIRIKKDGTKKHYILNNAVMKKNTLMLEAFLKKI